MVRIKIKTLAGKIFLSPFIYTESAAKWLIKQLCKWHTKPDYTLEPILLEESPVDCLYNQTRELDDVMEKLVIAERIWSNGNYERIGDAHYGTNY